MVDAAATAFTRAGVYRVGQPVTFQRQIGQAPNAVTTPAGGAQVTAVVRNYQPDTTAEAASGYSASQIGNITEGDRQIIVMKDDLTAAGFPLPVQKGDQVIIAETGELLSVTRVDPAKRFMANCIELYAIGVA